MLAYDDISNYCLDSSPDLIYLSIGCAQNGNPVSNEQQVPPFIKAVPGRIVLILVDPALESPPQAFEDLGFPTHHTTAPVSICGRFDIIALRQEFNWSSDVERSFIDALCALTLHTNIRLIVQDFSGANIHKYYPLRAFGPELLPRAIFDVTHDEGCCYVNWNEHPPQFMNPETGDFIHAWHQPLAVIKPYVTQEVYKQQRQKRTNLLTEYVHRLYKIQAGEEEPRDWCTPERVAEYAEFLFDAYNINLATDNSTLSILLIDAFRDIVTAEGHTKPTASAVISLIDAPFGEYRKALASPGPRWQVLRA